MLLRTNCIKSIHIVFVVIVFVFDLGTNRIESIHIVFVVIVVVFDLSLVSSRTNIRSQSLYVFYITGKTKPYYNYVPSKHQENCIETTQIVFEPTL